MFQKVTPYKWVRPAHPLDQFPESPLGALRQLRNEDDVSLLNTQESGTGGEGVAQDRISPAQYGYVGWLSDTSRWNPRAKAHRRKECSLRR